MNGLLVLDKPAGMTSRDVVNRVQKWFPRKTKIGHTGTLDPLATGVLVVCIGAATRLADLVQNMPKTYHSRFRLGARSTTDDADGDVTFSPEVTSPSREEIEAELKAFLGPIVQVPPSFSAAKLSGVRAYDLAREGKATEIAPRTVRVDAIRVLAYEPPFLDVEIDCGKGTYIRSIARDLGEALGCGGMVETLRRTRIGTFRVEDGLQLDADARTVAASLLPMSHATSELDRMTLDDAQILFVRQGKLVNVAGFPEGQRIALFDAQGELIGIAESKGNDLIHSPVVLKR